MQIELDGVRRNQNRYPPGQKMLEHCHDRIQVTLVISGQVKERVGRVEFAARSLDVVVKPAGVAHENEFGPKGARTLQVELDPNCLGESGSNDRLQTWGWYRNDLLTRRFLRLLGDRSSAKPPLDRLQGLLCALWECPTAVPPNQPPAWIESVRRRVDERFVQPVRVRELACEARVHRVYLARVFRACYGQSITGRLGTLRVTESARLLSETEMPLAVIAQLCGFADQSHLSRVFKSYTGMPPGRFRRLAIMD